jgi:predicted RecB family nuclease
LPNYLRSIGVKLLHDVVQRASDPLGLPSKVFRRGTCLRKYGQPMKITSSLFEAFIKCPTKCYLRSTGQAGSGNAYAEWVQAQNDAYRAEAGKRLVSGVPEAEVVIAPPAAEDLKAAKWRLAFDLPMEAANMEARLHAVQRLPSEGRGRPSQFIPIRFTFFNKLNKDDRLLLAFDALALSEALGREITVGKIIHGDDHATLKIKVESLLGTARKIAGKMSPLLTGGAPPDLILIRHCVECEFRDLCRLKAVEKDDLSLITGITEKERRRLRKKGILTLTQLSYTFRPKRPRKRIAARHENYHPALKALAIRERKIHIVGTPELKIEGTPVFLDVEALPDREFYYLIGAVAETATGVEPRSFWADSPDQEKTIWADFLAFLATVPNPILVHYGSFETAFLKRMCSQYGGPPPDQVPVVNAVEQSLNLLSFLFGRVYFPTYSNGLKEVGAFVGARWEAPGASGVQSLVWRYKWEETHYGSFKQDLLAYNRDDCQAVRLLTAELKEIGRMAASRKDVDYAYAPKRHATEQGAAVHGHLEAILASAHSDYERTRIHFRKRQQGQGEAPCSRRISPIKARHFSAKAGKVVPVPTLERCPIHQSKLLEQSEQEARHTIIHLAFTKTGCRKVLTTYVGKRAYCRTCRESFVPHIIARLKSRIFGESVVAWVAYHRVALRVPLGAISRSMLDLFSIIVNESTLVGLINRAAERHKLTENLLWQQILRSPVIHVDETKINILGTIQYVWVLTDGKHAVFRLTANRETQFLGEFLAGYEGTLVSDFYPGYDSMPCRQQKCLVHLIRDLNDDLWKNPFNSEYERFVVNVRNLLVPILEDVEKYGLKQRHLRKHEKAVARFYKRSIDVAVSQCEITAKYQKRFIHYRESLFTFLGLNGIPWHNNVAENAIRHLAVQRKISNCFYCKGATEYLRLLGVAQSCRLQRKSFLHFLLSGCANVDEFKKSHYRKRETDSLKPALEPPL